MEVATLAKMQNILEQLAAVIGNKRRKEAERIAFWLKADAGKRLPWRLILHALAAGDDATFRTAVNFIRPGIAPAGGLHGILEVIAKENINIAYMYAFVEKSGENAVMLFRFDQQDRAIEVLTKSGIAVLSGEKLYSF